MKVAGEISLTSKVKIASTAHEAEAGDELMVLGFESGDYFGVNPIGADIWKLVKESIVVSDLIDQLLQEYEVDRDTCQHHTLAFLNELKERSLLEVTEA